MTCVQKTRSKRKGRILTFIHEISIPGTLNQTATAANLTQLTGALNTYAPGALQMLEAIRGITVFAPVNAAFANVTTLLGTLNATQITDVLLKSVPCLSKCSQARFAAH